MAFAYSNPKPKTFQTLKIYQKTRPKSPPLPHDTHSFIHRFHTCLYNRPFFFFTSANNFSKLGNFNRIYLSICTIYMDIESHGKDTRLGFTFSASAPTPIWDPSL